MGLDVEFTIGQSSIIPETLRIKNAVVKTEKSEYSNNSKLFLHIIFEYETECGDIHEAIIPKIELPFANGVIPTITQSFRTMYEDVFPTIKIGDNEFPIRESSVRFTDQFNKVHEFNDAIFIDRIVKTKPREMTLSEIEKKLGHKVKIISEERKD